MRHSVKRTLTVSLVVALLVIPAIAGAVSGLAGPLFGLTTARTETFWLPTPAVGIEVLRKDQVKSTIPLPGVTDVTRAERPLGHDWRRGKPGGRHRTGAVPDSQWRTEAGGQPVPVRDREEPRRERPLRLQPLRCPVVGLGECSRGRRGRNDLLKVSKNGRVRVSAVFPDEVVSTANIKQARGMSGVGSRLLWPSR